MFLCFSFTSLLCSETFLLRVSSNGNVLKVKGGRLYFRQLFREYFVTWKNVALVGVKYFLKMRRGEG